MPINKANLEFEKKPLTTEMKKKKKKKIAWSNLNS